VTDSPNRELQDARDLIAKQTAEFEAAGGKVQYVPSGLRTDVPTMSYNGPMK